MLIDNRGLLKRLSHLFIDGGYKRTFEEWVKRTLGRAVQVMQRPDANFQGIWWPEDQPIPEDLAEELREIQRYSSFLVIPRRWVVERTFAWYSFNRRLNRYYELLPET